ncbi:hypothetical protein ONO86_01528 [Micromonospora noduli]|nr:hypothetical protein ONO86_01528 [Micromonospora noduli]
MSVAAETGCPVACSGDMYEAVPSTMFAAVSPAMLRDRAMPKSTSTTVPSPLTSRLPGFTSRCTMPARWAVCSASAAWASTDMVVAGSSRPTARTRADNGSPSTYSITR